MRKRDSYLFIVVAAFAFCTPRTGLKDVSAKEHSAQNSRQETATQDYKESEVNAKLTYIDTLNKGHEISLVQTAAQKTTPDAANSHYCIQIMASSQIESVRAKKKEMEGNTKLSLNIVFDSPFYKLYAGDFIKRTDAESELAKLKKLGVSDAWIVTTAK